MTRVFLSVSLLFMKPCSAVFFFFYILCGMSDILDGYIARKMGTCSKLGQSLDSVADFIFIGIALYMFIPMISCRFFIIGWIIFVAVIRLASFIVGFVKYHQLAFLHTYANKVTGIALFFFPIVYYVLGKDFTTVLVCLIASISATEELLINLGSKTLNRDVSSIFRI